MARSKLLYGNETPKERLRQAKRYAYLLEHHMAVLLRLFPTPDTCDDGVNFMIDKAIKEQENADPKYDI